jgi:hypothetical protein
MTNLVCEFMNSYWSSTEMNPTTSLALLTHDLEVRSSGSPGRRLLQRLKGRPLDLLGATGVLEFAHLLQRSEVRNRLVLERLLGWTFQDNEFALIALVALAPELDYLAGRLSAGRPSEDAVAEILAQATDATQWAHELGEGQRVAFVLDHTLGQARAEQRSMARHNVPTCSMMRELDAGELASSSHRAIPEWLARAEEQRIITGADCDLIASTRGGAQSLHEFAVASGLEYNALRMRRSRAETRLRRFYGATEVTN